MITEPFPGETLLADGWQYRDTPPMLVNFWDELLHTIGEGNYRLLTFMERSYKGDERLYRRGQMLISPTGMENLKVWAAKFKDAKKDDDMPSPVATAPRSTNE